MDQAVERASITIDDIAADVARDGVKIVERDGKPGFVALSLREYVRLRPVPGWLAEIWDDSVARGLDGTTMAEIDSAVEEVRREHRQASNRRASTGP